MALFERDLNFDATELRLGLPGTSCEEVVEKQTPVVAAKSNKRSLPHMTQVMLGSSTENCNVSSIEKKRDQQATPPTKEQVVGWPPIRSYRRNCLQAKNMEGEAAGIYIKVSMDGAPFLRKIDMKVYHGYAELFKVLEDLFKFKVGHYSDKEGFNLSEFVFSYEDKDGDWMLVGDVPWEMFISSCKRLRIMKWSEARGLGCDV